MPTLTAPVAIPQGKELELEDQEFELDIRVTTITISTLPKMGTDSSPDQCTTGSLNCTGMGASCLSQCGCSRTELCKL